MDCPAWELFQHAVFPIAIVSSSMCTDDWSQPNDPNPHGILEEARADTQAKRYSTALAKHVWFHENALSIQASLYGVRLSFALGYWSELANEYPPALMKLKEVRDTARKNALCGINVRESFNDMRSINEDLEEESVTKEVFEFLDEHDPENASRVFELARRSLVRNKAYSLTGKYISPTEDFAKIRANYRQDKNLAKDTRFGARHLDIARKRLANDSTTLVALLILNNRKEDAEGIAASARAEWDDKLFHSALERALKGVVPDPWP